MTASSSIRPSSPAPAGPWLRLQRRLFGLSPKEVDVERRGFRSQSAPVRERLETVGRSFLHGYHAALETGDVPSLALRLETLDPERQGFANEGAGMALALLDRLTPWKRDRLTLAVAGPGPAACDAESVVERLVSVWQDLLGPERHALAGIIARYGGANLTSAATPVWTAAECLKKAGAAPAAPLTLTATGSDTWTLLKSGDLTAASCMVQVSGTEQRLAITLLVGTADADEKQLTANGRHGKG